MINWGSRGDCQSTMHGFSDDDVTSIGSPSGQEVNSPNYAGQYCGKIEG